MNKYDWETVTALTKMTLVIVILIFGLIWWSSGLTVGAEYNTVGTVKLYEHSSWISPHTWVILETFGGIEFEVTLTGYHDFELGQTYQIRTVRERGGFLNVAEWYEVVSIEAISNHDRH